MQLGTIPPEVMVKVHQAELQVHSMLINQMILTLDELQPGFKTSLRGAVSVMIEKYRAGGDLVLVGALEAWLDD